MPLSLKSRMWMAASALTALNVGFAVDSVQAYKAAYGPEGQGDVIPHMHATKAMSHLLEHTNKKVGPAGAFALSAAFQIFILPAAPGIISGEYIGKALYKPTTNKPL